MLHVLLHTSFSGCLSLPISASDMESNCLESAISWGYSCLFLMETQTSDPPNTSKQQSNPLLRDPLAQQSLCRRKSTFETHWASPSQASASSVLDPYSTAKRHRKPSAQIYMTFQYVSWELRPASKPWLLAIEGLKWRASTSKLGPGQTWLASKHIRKHPHAPQHFQVRADLKYKDLLTTLYWSRVGKNHNVN